MLKLVELMESVPIDGWHYGGAYYPLITFYFKDGELREPPESLIEKVKPIKVIQQLEGPLKVVEITKTKFYKNQKGLNYLFRSLDLSNIDPNLDPEFSEELLGTYLVGRFGKIAKPKELNEHYFTEDGRIIDYVPLLLKSYPSITNKEFQNGKHHS